MARRRGKRGGKRARKQRAKSSRFTRLIAQEFTGADVPQAFDLEGYFGGLRSSIWLAACAYRLSFAIASVGFQIKKRSDMTEAKGRNANRIRDLFHRINPEETYFDFLEQKMLHLAVGGASYTEKARNRLGETAELYEWSPDLVTPVPDKTGRRRIKSYKFTSQSGGQVELPRDDVIPVKVYNPDSPYRGFSFVSPMKIDLSADIKAARYNRSFLQRGAKISGFLKPENGDLGDDEWRRIKAEFTALYSGPDRAGDVAVLPSGLDFRELGTNPKDLDWEVLRKWVREVAAGGLGVPPILIGNFDAASYANTEQQLRAFWDYVGKPWLRKIWSSINEFLVHPEIDDKLVVEPNYLEIDSLIDSETTRVQNTSTQVQGGWMTINEARQRSGLQPLPDGDRLLLPLALDPVDPTDLERDTQPAPQGPPPGGEEPEEEEEEEEPEKRAKVSARGRSIMRGAHAYLLAEEEARIELAARKYLQDAKGRTLARLEDTQEPETVAGNVEAEARRAMEILSPVFLAVVERGGDDGLEKLGMSKVGPTAYRRKVDSPDMLPQVLNIVGTFDELNPRVIAYLEVLFAHIEDLTRRTLEDVRSIVRRGLEDGLGVQEIANNLEDAHAFSALRAEKIARTETAAALNLGVNEAFRAAGTSRKSWLSAKDERTRDSHTAAEAKYSAEPIALGQKFVLEDPDRGVAELMFPADPEAPGWASINCRCAMVPEQDEARAYWLEQCEKQVAECAAY